MPFPPAGEQEEIVGEVEHRLSVIEEIEAQADANLKRAVRLRQSILKRAFEGRLVPQNLADEPADNLLERIRQERAAGNGQVKSERPTRARRGNRKPKAGGTAE